MVLGLKSKKKKGASIRIDYAVHIEEIKPWPPSESLKSVQSVLLQWQNGDQNSGSFLTVAGDTNIVFNESFTLPLTLRREKKALDKFQKNFLEFSLYEPRKEKGTKGQLLGTAIINLADFGVIEDIITIAAPLSCKKSSKNSMQPELFVHIEPLDKNSSKSSPNIRSSRTSIDDGQGSHADLDDDESEIASFTDDDISSHSSQTLGSSTFEVARASPSQNDKNGPQPANETTGQERSNGNLPPLQSVSSSSDVADPVNTSNSRFSERSMTLAQKKPIPPSIQSYSSFTGYPDINGKSKNYIKNLERGSEVPGFRKEGKTGGNAQELVKEDNISRVAPKFTSSGSNQSSQDQKDSEGDTTFFDDEYLHLMGADEETVDKSSIESMRRQATMRNSSSIRKSLGVQMTNGRLKHVKSELYDSSGRNKLFGNTENAAKVHTADGDGTNMKTTKKKKDELSSGKSSTTADTEKKEIRNKVSEIKIESESKIKMLEEELSEAAVLEVGLYSVVAEHGSSINKVHAPARRLSRFYFHACKENSRAKQASAARAAISGLVLVSKACGNDVPRLTFWLSNTIVLRAIISQTATEVPHLNRGHLEKINTRASMSKSSTTSSKRDEGSSVESNSLEESDGWEDTETFVVALERTESWIFSRIIESIWWQTLTPHMQTAVAKANGKSKGTNTKKSSASKYGLGDQEQGNFSIELWKKAFRDACERLCPIRTEGHECGCLPLMARLVMEQLVIRLDVAMFNAILRESAEDMPSDPVSDPISDPRVLPILAGNLSFGAGAQLKNAIGNWSRWLSDLFEIEDNESPENNNVIADERGVESSSFKPFRLLNALSDVMMLPFEMLTDKSARREVCPLLGASLIRQVFCNFVPDQFCPYPIPQNVIDALDDEDDEIDASTETITSHPCTAPQTIYSPPQVTSLANFVREVGNHTIQRNGSSLLKKSYTSDDELDELDTRLTYIIADNSRISAPRKVECLPKGKWSRKVSRYQLLRKIWNDYEE